MADALPDTVKIDQDPGASTSETPDEFTLQEKKLKGKAAAGEHQRREWIENCTVIALLIIGGFGVAAYVIAFVIIAIHNLAAPAYLWLTETQVHKLEAVVFSSAAAAILGAVGRKYVR